MTQSTQSSSGQEPPLLHFVSVCLSRYGKRRREVYRYFILIYAVSSLILGARTATYPTARATPIAQHLVATPSPLLPTPTSTITPTPSPTLMPTSTSPATWQLLWFGTAGGVSAFDGQNWTTYTVADGLASNLVNAIVPDQAGNIWFATDGGVSKFDGQSWVTYTEADGLADGTVNAITFDTAGHAWFGTGAGVSELILPALSNEPALPDNSKTSEY